ncbi:unnamed protein product [Prunus armeniaca]
MDMDPNHCLVGQGSSENVVRANILKGECLLEDPSSLEFPSLSSSIHVKKTGVNRPHPGGVGQRPFDA